MRAAFHHRHRPLAKLRVILRHDKNLPNQWVCADNPLHLFRLNTFSAAKKEVIHSSEDSQPAVLQLSPIAGGEPAVGISNGDRLPIAPVAFRHAVRAQPDLAIDKPVAAPAADAAPAGLFGERHRNRRAAEQNRF